MLTLPLSVMPPSAPTVTRVISVGFQSGGLASSAVSTGAVRTMQPTPVTSATRHAISLGP